MPHSKTIALKVCLLALNDAPSFRFNAGDNSLGLKTNPRNLASSYDLAAAVEKILAAPDQRDLATILAALRFWQRVGLANPAEPEHDIASEGGLLDPLDRTEIDALCDDLNR